jgi:hypothetical protein
VNNAIGNLQAVHLLELLQEPKVQQQIRDAEIVVLESGPLQSDLDHIAALLQTCFNPSPTPREAPPPTATEDWEPYRDDLRASYDLVFELPRWAVDEPSTRWVRAGSPAPSRLTVRRQCQRVPHVGCAARCSTSYGRSLTVRAVPAHR